MSQSFSLVVFVALSLAFVSAGCAKTGLSEQLGGDRDGGHPPAPDAAVSCERASDCDDGLVCNGEEACVSGTCVPGTPPCDDGIACTVDLCDEGIGLCTSSPSQSLCAEHERCDSVLGCVAVGCTADADCDDGLFCNGQESCSGSGCAPGGPVGCDDGDPCTVEACDEGALGCVFAAVDADTDGFPSVACGGGDCDDADPERSPGLAEVCGTGVDEDCDLAVDCADPDCADLPACCVATAESCTNRVDDDCDGAIDCADPSCEGARACALCVSFELCVGGRDWDCDGLYGCDDPDCAVLCGPIVLPF